MKKENILEEDFLKLARLALSGRPQDIQLFLYKVSKRYKENLNGMTQKIVNLLQESPTRSSPLRKHSDIPLPVDVDSRLQLLRLDEKNIEDNPILTEHIQENIDQIINEREKERTLRELGLHPTKSLLFTGPPGVGKTLTAKWLATKLNRPLLILDLAAVMSSYLGRTGNNIRFVLDYAKNVNCVLLLDELDAIAKRRDDQSEIGELKRLVTVLLQEIDDWPDSGLLIAATNHSDLLDPAIWRRFEMIIRFENPGKQQIQQFIKHLLKDDVENIDLWSTIFSFLYLGESYSIIEKEVLQLKKVSALNKKPIEEVLKASVKMNTALHHEDKVEFARYLIDSGLLSQRAANELTGISRDTIRKYAIKKNKKEK